LRRTEVKVDSHQLACRQSIYCYARRPSVAGFAVPLNEVPAVETVRPWYMVASMCQGVYNKTKISFSAIIIETNTSWSEATQQHYCGSTTRPRRYGRSMAAKTANVRRPIRRLPWNTVRSTLRRGESTTRPDFFDPCSVPS